jgi:hypothetical protein
MRAALPLALLAALAGSAAGDERITDDTPYQTPPGKVRLGLWKAQYSPAAVPRLEVGTYALPWLAAALSVPVVNGHAKVALWHRGRWALSGAIGMVYADFSHFTADAKLTIVPTQALAACRLSQRFTVTGGLMYTHMFGEAKYEEDEIGALRGAVAASNVQAWAAVMLGLTSRWTVYTELRSASSVEVSAGAEGTARVDDAQDEAFPDIQAAALAALARLCPPGLAAAIVSLRHSPDRRVRQAAAHAQGRCRIEPGRRRSPR